MALYELDEQVINNLIVFLDRIEYKGIKEIEAISQILYALKQPIQKE